MTQRIDAIFEDGVFRPEVPINIANGERVSLDVERKAGRVDDLGDVEDLLDTEYVESCRRNEGVAPSRDEVRNLLSAFDGSLADWISRERDER